MGQWGEETFSGDSPMDFLQHYPDGGDLDKMTQKLATKTLNKTWAETDSKEQWDTFDRLGVVVWLLAHGFTVPIDKIEQCMKYANTELRPDILENWSDPEGRKAEVVREMNEMRAALENGGKGKKRDKEAKGLLEKMSEFIETLPSYAWILKWDNEDELTEQVVSKDVEKLKELASETYNEELNFIDRGTVIFVHAGKGKNNREIAMIMKVQVI